MSASKSEGGKFKSPIDCAFSRAAENNRGFALSGVSEESFNSMIFLLADLQETCAGLSGDPIACLLWGGYEDRPLTGLPVRRR